MKQIIMGLLVVLFVFTGCGKVKVYPTSMLEFSIGGTTDDSTYPFEVAGDLNGFGIANEATNLRFTAIALSPTKTYKGLSSAAITCNFNASNSGGILSRTGSNILMAGKHITARIYVPKGMFPDTTPYGCTVFIKLANYHWYESTWKNLTLPSGDLDGIWNTLDINVETDLKYNAKTLSGNGDNADTTSMWGVKVGQGGTSPNFAGTIYIDSINVQ